ncbi:4-hydroxy-tetrahydrodipicolinate synthase [Veillonella montpellierensis]|uniref:4-hydroxy-tetrahydrodipicolinate synthase n=1 Tax=Veillonella montpellierensis TaxID=187328 RepID=UPI0023F7D5BB|nr:4-hydroxy-tetrahydrodipicolinate synthase [Veillonella montpellierensis]
MKTFGRVITAMITPFCQDGTVDFEGSVQLANYLLDHGSDGLVVCGTTGESPTISDEDKLLLFQRIVESCGKKGTIIANTGTNSTQHSVEFTKRASATGVDALMAVVPFYNKPNQEGQYLHFKAIAEASSLPIMIYNVPGRVGTSITANTLARLHREYPHICAIKEASGNLNLASEIKYSLPDSFMMYSGDDGLTLPLLSVGACGVISVVSHIAGTKMSNMIQAYEENRALDAERIHRELVPLFKAMFITTNPIPIKYAVRKMGLPAGPFHLPMCEPNDAEAAVIESALEPYK